MFVEGRTGEQLGSGLDRRLAALVCLSPEGPSGPSTARGGSSVARLSLLWLCPLMSLDPRGRLRKKYLRGKFEMGLSSRGHGRQRNHLGGHFFFCSRKDFYAGAGVFCSL